jgi:hypothetical protein
VINTQLLVISLASFVGLVIVIAAGVVTATALH